MSAPIAIVRASRFRSREAFRSSQPYRFLPFRFERLASDEVLLVNEVGEHLFLATDTFERFASHKLSLEEDPYLDLKGKHFLQDGDESVSTRLLALKVRTRKAHLAGFTKLHMFVVTLRCEHSCQYCQVSRVTQDRDRFDMSEDTARRAIDCAFHSPAERLKIEFQGGEPLLHFERIVQVVREAKSLAATAGRAVDFVVASNLA